MITNRKIDIILDKLDLGPQNTSSLSKEANIPRTTVDYLLKSLLKKSYVVSRKSGQETIWEKNEVVDENTKIIYGIDNIVKSFKKAVNKKGIEVIIIESDKTMEIAEDKRYNDSFKELNQKFHDKNALIYILFHKKTIQRINRMTRESKIKKATIYALTNRAMSAYLLPDDLFDLNIHVAVIGEKIFLTDFENARSVMMENVYLASFFKHFFTLITRIQEKANVAEILKDIIGER